jgi:hypothetical protein
MATPLLQAACPGVDGVAGDVAGMDDVAGQMGGPSLDFSVPSPSARNGSDKQNF